MPKAQYDKQGNYFHHLCKLAGWDNYRIQRLLLKHFSCSHWLALSEEQRRAAIVIMKSYAGKQVQITEKQLRGSIMRTTFALKYNDDWLHIMLPEWGYPSKLHDCSLEQLLDIQHQLRQLGKSKASA